METYDDQLKHLKEELQQILQAIDTANNTLLTSQAALEQLKRRKTGLERVISDIEAAQSGLDKPRDNAQTEIDAAIKLDHELLPRLQEELSDERRHEIAALIKSVDDEIAAARQKVWNLKGQIKTKEQELAAATAAAADATAAFQEAQTQLRQLPAQIQAGQQQLARLRTAAKTTFDGGKESEAYFLIKDLETAITSLQSLIDPQTEADRAHDLDVKWHAMVEANGTAATKAAELAALLQQLQAAEQDRDAKVQGRDAKIKAGLAGSSGSGTTTTAYPSKGAGTAVL